MVVIFVVFVGIEPPDAEKEKTGILALQIKEREVPHSVSGHTQWYRINVICKTQQFITKNKCVKTICFYRS